MGKKQTVGDSPFPLGCFLIGVAIWFVMSEYGPKM